MLAEQFKSSDYLAILLELVPRNSVRRARTMIDSLRAPMLR